MFAREDMMQKFEKRNITSAQKGSTTTLFESDTMQTSCKDLSILSMEKL